MIKKTPSDITQLLSFIVVLVFIQAHLAYAGELSDEENYLVRVKSDKESRLYSTIKSARESKSIKNKSELQKVLKISRGRTEKIIIGEEGRRNVIGFVANSDGGKKFECDDFNCSCVGDDDCNLMFTTVCSSPSTNGSCTIVDPPDGVICGCNPPW